MLTAAAASVGTITQRVRYTGSGYRWLGNPREILVPAISLPLYIALPLAQYHRADRYGAAAVHHLYCMHLLVCSFHGQAQLY